MCWLLDLFRSPPDVSGLHDPYQHGPRWGLITFAPDWRQLDRIATVTPKIKLLTVVCARDIHAKQAPSEDYVSWASSSIADAMIHGFDVIVHAGPNVRDNSTLGTDVVAIVQAARQSAEEARARMVSPGRIVAVSFDVEWMNPKHFAYGVQGYVDAVVPAIRLVRRVLSGVEILGPGGTHSDDETLPLVLKKLRDADATPHIVTFHWYSDKGRDKAERRVDELRLMLSSMGISRAAITECGVTGQIRWGDGLSHGTADDRHFARFQWMKGHLDSQRWLKYAMIYQITEAESPEGEDHGWGFGLWDSRWFAKSATSLFT